MQRNMGFFKSSNAPISSIIWYEIEPSDEDELYAAVYPSKGSEIPNKVPASQIEHVPAGHPRLEYIGNNLYFVH